MSAVEDSPSKVWTKPSHVMKFRMKRQRRSTSDVNTRSPSQQAHGRLKSTSHLGNAGESRSGKRRNPFGSGGGAGGTASRRRVQSEVVGGERTADKENGSPAVGHQKLFSALDSQQDEVFNEEACQRLTAAIKSMEAEEASPRNVRKQQQQTVVTPSSSLPEGRPSLTADWCLRTRLRFTSRSSFKWCQPIRMKEEASGLCSFVQGDQYDPDMEVSDSSQEPDWRSRLQQATMCWMHPNLPWLSLFPRMVPEPKTFKQSVAVKEPSIGNALMASWSESFRSVYQLLRSGHCPYFYLCTHHFTVLFRAGGLAATPQLHALLSPTTRGLRESLKTEGIDFTMPLHGEPKTQADQTDTASTAGETAPQSGDEPETRLCSEGKESCPTPKKELFDDDDEEGEEDEDSLTLRSPTKASSWLQSMGLDRTEFPSLEPSRVKFQTDPLLKLDNRPASLVLVAGPDTQALYNFLLNSRAVMTSVGALADIPPTILAPVAFKGATLNSCKIKSGVLKQQSHSASLEEVSSLEVTGSIMPHNIHDLCTLLRTTQDGAFHMALSNHEATAPFTTCTQVQARSSQTSSIHDTGLQQLQSNCKLSDSQVEYLARGCTINAPVKEILCQNGLYH